MTDPEASGHSAFTELADWILSDDFTCLGARAALRRGVLSVAHSPSLGTVGSTALLHQGLEEFTKNWLVADEDFGSFVAVFDAPRSLSEEQFESLLWQQLLLLHRYDAQRYPWSVEVDRDPGSTHFGFSVVNHPFFIVGMHANSSRLSRRSPRPAIVFNCHRQFKRLRASGAYAGLQKKIRERELRLQGSINPNLAAPGEDSEAKQYSGRFAQENWVCPFDPGNL